MLFYFAIVSSYLSILIFLFPENCEFYVLQVTILCLYYAILRNIYELWDKKSQSPFFFYHFILFYLFEPFFNPVVETGFHKNKKKSIVMASEKQDYFSDPIGWIFFLV